MEERDYIYLFSCLEKMGPVHFERMLSWYGTAEKAWKAENPPLPAEMAEEWKKEHAVDTVERRMLQLEDMSLQGIRFLTRMDQEFPENFHHLADCPIGIYLKGSMPPPLQPVVAIIGARKCTAYGRNLATLLAEDMAKQGISVISGMALGIDAAAQWTALEQGGYSMGILGSGVDICYPVANLNLHKRLAREGGLLSEYPMGTKALAFHFPKRNRLISALADIVVVVEAREKSGTLITVDQALEQGKDVLAFPGRIGDSMSEGCNQLIHQGAGICLGAISVYQALGWTPERIQSAVEEKKNYAKVRLDAKERRILSAFDSVTMHIDILVKKTGVPVQELMICLWELEKKGYCRQTSSTTYQKLQ